MLPEPTYLQKGQVLANNYQVEGLIGTGGFGNVYKGQHLGFEMPIAIKTLNIESSEVTAAQMPELLARFKREAKSLAQLRHPGIVHVWDYGMASESTPYLVLDYFPGRPLLAWGEEAKPNTRQWLVLFRQMFDALDHAHALGIIHRDIKSANVLVSGTANDAKALLIDWGIACSVGGPRFTQDGMLVGTEGCIDPELGQNEDRDFVPQSDLYAAGGLLYWAICGCEPFDVGASKSPAARLHAIRANRIRPPSMVVDDIADSLNDFLLRLLATKQSDRPPTAKACIAIIDALLRDEDVDLDAVCEAHRPPQPPTVSVGKPRSDGEPAEQAPDDARLLEEIAGLGELSADAEAVEAEAEEPPPEPRVVFPEEVARPVVDVSSVPDGRPSVAVPAQSRASMLKKKASEMGIVVPAAQQHWKKYGPTAAAVVLTAVLMLALTRNRTPAAEAEPAPVAKTYRAEDLEPKRDESALAKFTPEVSNAAPAVAAAGASLDNFPPDIRAKYDTTIGGPLPQAPVNPSPSPKSSGRASAPKGDAAAIDKTLAPVATAEERTGQRDRSPVPHNTEAVVRLLEALDTSSDEPVRAELQAPVLVGDTAVIPAGSLLWGHASFRYNRAQVRFDKATFPDGRELHLTAIAVTRDGREGIDGGRIEFGEAPSSKAGEKALRAVGAVAAEAIGALPGGDVLTRASQNVARDEVKDAMQAERESPRSSTRIVLQRKTSFKVKFQAQ